MPKTSEVTEVVERDLKRFSEQIHQELQAIRKQLHESISSRFDKIDGSVLNLLKSVNDLAREEYLFLNVWRKSQHEQQEGCSQIQGHILQILGAHKHVLDHQIIQILEGQGSLKALMVSFHVDIVREERQAKERQRRIEDKLVDIVREECQAKERQRRIEDKLDGILDHLQTQQPQDAAAAQDDHALLGPGDPDAVDND